MIRGDYLLEGKGLNILFLEFEVSTSIRYLINGTKPVSRYRLKIEYMERPEDIDPTYPIRLRDLHRAGHITTTD
jgi:hypothetical protein